MDFICKNCAKAEKKPAHSSSSFPTVEVSVNLLNNLKRTHFVNVYANHKYNENNLTGSDLENFRDEFNSLFTVAVRTMENVSKALKEDTDIGIYLLPLTEEHQVLKLLRLRLKDSMASTTRNLGYRYLLPINLVTSNSPNKPIKASLVVLVTKEVMPKQEKSDK